MPTCPVFACFTHNVRMAGTHARMWCWTTLTELCPFDWAFCSQQALVEEINLEVDPSQSKLLVANATGNVTNKVRSKANAVDIIQKNHDAYLVEEI